jgi:hypothetical protein
LTTAGVKRPLSVTIIGIIAGLFFTAAGSILLSDMNLAIEGRIRAGIQDQGSYMFDLPTETLVYLVFTLGVILLLLGILSFIVGRGTLEGKGWSWIANLILTYTNIAAIIIELILYKRDVGNIVTAIASIAINVTIIYYLYTPHVKQYFGKMRV